jgi:hypothetical protein
VTLADADARRIGGNERERDAAVLGAAEKAFRVVQLEGQPEQRRCRR